MATRKAKQVIESNTQGEQADREIAKQLRERNRGASDGGVHAVSHTVHKSRKQEAAAVKEVVKPPRRRWQRPSALPAVPRLEGFHVEYVRRDNRNRMDCANLLAHLRSGWELCRISDWAEAHLPTNQLTGHGEVIGNDDTILMKIDEDTWAERNEAYNSERDRATAAISGRELSVDVSHPAMPIVDAVNRHEAGYVRSRVRRNNRQSVKVADD